MDRPQSPTPEEMMPRPAAIFLAAPLVAIAIVFGLYAYLFAHGWTGRAAAGATVKMHFSACAQAEEVVRTRVEEMGLGAPEFHSATDGFSLTAVLPDEPESVEQIPATLATRGLFELRGGGNELLVDNGAVVSSGVRLDMTMTPTTLIVLTLEGAKVVAKHMNGDPDGRMSYFIDGAEVHDQSNRKPFSDAELEIPVIAENDRAVMARAAHFGIIIGNPLPCDAKVASEVVIAAPGA